MRATFSPLAIVNYLAKSSYYCESTRLGLIAALLIAMHACSDAPQKHSTIANSAAEGVSVTTAEDPRALAQGVAGNVEDDNLPQASTDITVLVFGDSISAAYGIQRDDGWVALLQQRLTRQYPDAKVINASVSGETTQGGRARLKASLDRHSPDLVFLELGGNDALRGYPIDRLRDNLTTMVTQAQTQGAKVVLLGMQIPPNYGPQYTREFAQTFQTVADENKAHLVPFFLEGVALIEGMIQSDGIHPTTRAQPLLVETGWQALVSTLSERYPLLH